MKTDRIFWSVMLTVLVINKAIEMYYSIDMIINPAGTTAKIIALCVAGIIVVKDILKPLLRVKVR